MTGQFVSHNSTKGFHPMAVSFRESVCRTRAWPVNEDLLIRRAKLLPPKDRDLMLAVFLRGQTAGSLARLMGEDAWVIRRRLIKLSRRMTSRSFTGVLKTLPYLTPPDAELARLRYCQGTPVCELAARLDVSPHLLRRQLDRISAQIVAICRIHNPALHIDRDSLTRYA